MSDATRWITIVGQLPQFLYTDALDLWLTGFIEPESLRKLFG